MKYLSWLCVFGGDDINKRWKRLTFKCITEHLHKLFRVAEWLNRICNFSQDEPIMLEFSKAASACDSLERFRTQLCR